jgi:hypothetical protein
MGVAVMDDHRQVELARLPQHVAEFSLLVGPGRVLVMIIEPDLAVRHDLFVLREVPDDIVGRMENVLDLMRMDADRGR